MKRSTIMLFTVILVVAILAAGAFVTAQLLTPPANAGEGEGPGVTVYEDVFDDGSGNPVTVKTIIEPAAELPDRPAEASGIFLNEQDSSYFVGTGSVSVNISVVNGERSVATNHSGPEIEVVVTHETKFYKDITEIDYAANESVERHYQQTLKEVPQPAQMLEGSSLSAWGERRGDRVIADLIVFGETE